MVVLPAYSRSQEADADEKAIEILRAEGDADPAGTMAHTFEVLLTREGAKGGGLVDTHPNMTERLEAMRTLQARQPRTEPSRQGPPHCLQPRS
ncbi:MAG: M48 family metalloprotease [Deltaproteobacteria bacterium]|nr:M48 family metalloprotease [Deltaproteobacteria bacterium]